MTTVLFPGSTVKLSVRILRGARAGDLSVEEAVKFDVVINVAAANSLALKIPASLRQRADLVGHDERAVSVQEDPQQGLLGVPVGRPAVPWSP